MNIIRIKEDTYTNLIQLLKEKDKILKEKDNTIKNLEVQLDNIIYYVENKGISVKKFKYDKKYLDKIKTL